MKRGKGRAKEGERAREEGERAREERERSSCLSASARRSARINRRVRPTAINAFDKELKRSHCTWLSKDLDMA